MTYKELQDMLVDLRKEVANFCRGVMPTLDEVWSLEIALGIRCWNLFGKPGLGWDQDGFRLAIENTVKKEILKICE